MKTNVASNTVISKGITAERKSFGIAHNPVLYSILSEKLYSNIPLAVIRELSCNAYDIHKQLGKKEVPFDLHLPTGMQPWFSIRDYGSGLDEEDMHRLYSTFGGSTKSNENVSIGGFGIGSKSPFAYSDQFTVTSYFNNQKQQFTCFRDETGIPQIQLLSTKETTEANGLEVYMAVKPSDFNAFYDSAIKFYRRFPVTPNLTGYKVELTKVKYDYQSTDFSYRSYEDRGNSNFAIVEGVAYAISNNDVSKAADGFDFYQMLNKQRWELNFNIGEVTVAPNRESLIYDEKTKKAIQSKLRLALKEIHKIIEDKLKNLNTVWERSIFYKEVMRDSYSMYFGLTGSLKIDGVVSKFSFAKPDELIDKVKTGRYTKYDIRNWKNPRDNWKDYTPGCQVGFDVSAKTIIVFTNDKTLFTRRDGYIGAILAETYKSSCANGSIDDIIVIRSMNPKFDIQYYRDLFGGVPDIVDLKTLPLPPRAVVTNTPGQKAAPVVKATRTMIAVRDWGTAGQPSFHDEADIDINDKAYYFILYSGQPIADNKMEAKGVQPLINHSGYNIIVAARNLGLFGDTPVYFINYSKTGFLKDKTKHSLECGWTFLKKEIVKKASDATYLATLAEMELVGFWQQKSGTNFLEMFWKLHNSPDHVGMFDQINRKKPFGSYHKTSSELFAKIEKAQKKYGISLPHRNWSATGLYFEELVKKLAGGRLFSKMEDAYKKLTTFKEQTTQIEEQLSKIYPLTHELKHNYYSHFSNGYVDYISAIDKTL